MAETFALGSLVIPGPYVQVRAEGLIGAPAVSTGNVGIVGTAAKGAGSTRLVSTYDEAVTAFGAYDELNDTTGKGTTNLVRGLEVLYRNGGGAVYARAVAAGADQAAFTAAYNELVKDDVNILVAPELSTADAKSVLGPILESAENDGHDLIAVIGSDVDPTATDAVSSIGASVPTDDRIVVVTPGIRAFDSAAGEEVALGGNYSAAAVAGLLSTLTVQSSATNKSLPGVVALSHRYSYAEMKALVNARTLVLEQRGGVKVVRALTSDDGAFKRITTRRIVDYAKAGVRGVSEPFIGKLNNQRVRAALQGAINGFLTSMLVDEALVGFQLSVTASRDDEIAGRAMVNIILQPVFELEFVAVTLILE
jgi:phage tail sheath protein FI